MRADLPRRRARGFTLIELLVAIALLALLSLMSWRGIDGMARAQSQMRERGDAMLALQGALAQWQTDLDSVVTTAPMTAIDWNGAVLRITRRGSSAEDPAVRVVAWALRTDPDGRRWHRWQSPPVATRGDWQQAWQQAATWAEGASSPDPTGSDVPLVPSLGWRLLYFTNNAWTPAMPADSLGTNTPVPDGVRLVIELAPGPGLAGTIVRDWVRPDLTVTRS
ncbi:prepilin-type N-terminal cleavage/methylation domain-containing protein [Variovorax dokdonensis]|uniref:Prepilin-type N-terminal cleavage/methylation domain-containing protein n=1 Tax=Variovorax dokdonensis TaxID=344883 RepID=A0ABT7NBN4_9BURK|nr:prepilin-type N-terminal cleavage/methylation domain-containing protein [Variovorax dokdonensis]MDM0045338.1 prepilin-type N-terminal cleavage/methylation domain-containing protein [Variovorax dokdonensis]